MSDQQHPESVPRYPLEWPMGWKRTKSTQRVPGTFREGKDGTRRRWDSRSLSYRDEPARVQAQVSIRTATSRLEAQLDRLGAGVATLSTNLSLRLDGRPRANEGEPYDPGAAVYFTLNGRATVLACDRYQRVADNIAALAAHIDALRRIERYGVGTIEQALAGYKALPADTAADWRSVFGFAENSAPTVQEVDSAYKALAKAAHPDKGGTEVEMAHLNRAREFALSELAD